MSGSKKIKLKLNPLMKYRQQSFTRAIMAAKFHTLEYNDHITEFSISYENRKSKTLYRLKSWNMNPHGLHLLKSPSILKNYHVIDSTRPDYDVTTQSKLISQFKGKYLQIMEARNDRHKHFSVKVWYSVQINKFYIYYRHTHTTVHRTHQAYLQGGPRPK